MADKMPTGVKMLLCGALLYAGVQAASFALAGWAVRYRRKTEADQSAKESVPNATGDAEGAATPPANVAPTGSEGDNELTTRDKLFGEDFFYEAQVQPKFAPPAPVFAPVWFVNNALSLWGWLHVWRLPKDRPGRNAFLISQGVFWASFTTFNALYFGLRSTVAGAANTLVGFVAVASSVAVALGRLRDRRAALSQATTLPWLCLALPTATLIALWNRDEFYGAGPFAEPPSGWVKTPATEKGYGPLLSDDAR
jgi:tryptophan-rich sensory protein